MSFFTDNIRAGASGATDYEIERSLRFNNTDSTEVTNSSLGTSPTSRKIQTISVWFKRGDFDADGMMTHGFSGSGHSASGAALRFVSGGGNLSIENQVNNSQAWQLVTTRVFRDPAAWYHLVVAIDTTQGTSSNRVKIYVNGVQETSFSTANYPSQNYDNLWLYSNVRLGSWDGNGYYAGYNGYLAEYNAIDGQQLAPSDFGETNSDTGQWNPKKYTGSYGTNGHYLNFSDNSGTTATTLGKDYSGNGKNFTPSNLSVSAGVGNDSLEDTPTNNFCTFNRLNSIKYNANYDTIVEQGSLLMRGGDNVSPATMTYPKSGKWYCEFSKYGNGFSQGVSVVRADTDVRNLDGVTSHASKVTLTTYPELLVRGSAVSNNGTAWENDASAVIGVAVDMDNGAMYFAINNTWINSGDPTSGSSKTGAAATDLLTVNNGHHYVAAQGFNGNDNAGMYANFGQRPFTYTPPTDYKTLCTNNLPEPTILKGDKYFDIATWSGTGSSHNITGLNFQPDLVWVKKRSGSEDHDFQDSVRGATKRLSTNVSSAESTIAGSISSFNSDGFTVVDARTTNESGHTYVGWTWRAGTAFSNSAGSNSATIASSGSVNTTAGFSIVQYQGNATRDQLVYHGLNAAPKWFLVKRRDGDNWIMYHGESFDSNPQQYYYEFQNQDAVKGANDAFMWDDIVPNSNNFGIYSDGAVNNNGSNIMAWVWSEVEGFSKFGHFIGNGNANGMFIHCGFTPRFVMVKNNNQGYNTVIQDTKRSSGNVANKKLCPDNNAAEASANDSFDILSNGFKMRTSDAGTNASGSRYVFMAFASNPFKNARAR